MEHIQIALDDRIQHKDHLPSRLFSGSHEGIQNILRKNIQPFFLSDFHGSYLEVLFI